MLIELIYPRMIIITSLRGVAEAQLPKSGLP